MSPIPDLPSLEELVHRVYGAHIRREGNHIFLVLAEGTAPLEEEDLVILGSYGTTVYRVRLYVEERGYLVVPFMDVITPEEWPSLEEEPA